MKNILDAGPLVAAINSTDEHHLWARETLAQLGSPFYSCSEAMAEAAALTRNPTAIVEMIEAGDIILDFNLTEQAATVLSLLKKYRDYEMDLADACIVRMAELTNNCRVITLDRADFAVYRRNGRELIPLIIPPAKR